MSSQKLRLDDGDDSDMDLPAMKPSPSPSPSRGTEKKAPPRRGSSGYYQPVDQDDDPSGLSDAEAGAAHHTAGEAMLLQPLPRRQDRSQRRTVLIMAVAILVLIASNIYSTLPYFFHSGGDDARGGCRGAGAHVPQYFQTSPELWAGPTTTGAAPFLAQTRAFDPTATFVPNEPLQTAVPVEGMTGGDVGIFRMMGYLTPYSPSPGFGVDEFPVPDGAEIVQVQMLSRHGSRYPTSGSDTETLGAKVAGAGDEFKPKGPLAFLKDWRYQLGAEILVSKGREELFQSGVLHSYMYGSLYNPNSKLIVRTTTQDRMLKSAENWMAGFFGLEWTNNATIEVIIEDSNFNNSLAGSLACPNSWPKSSAQEARQAWVDIYLQNATARFQALTDGFEWTPSDVYAAQNMCPYETVAYGFSRFCELFTYEEWRDFGYSIDIAFAANSGFHSPTGRAVGLGYQQEVMARLKNHTLGYSGSQINVTLDSSTETFPLNQSLYFDFSHDTNIVSVLTAFGLRQFADGLPLDRYPGEHPFTVAHVTPFGARLDIEVVRAPKPVSPNRNGYLRGEETRYIHFVLNQRTLPLGKSFPECDESRVDGWCELETFLKVQDEMPARAQFDHACFGDYPKVPYGEVTDGVPT